MIRKSISIIILVAFILTSVKPPAYAQLASADLMPFMPKPGMMVHLSPQYAPAYLKGIVIHPENALKFDFIIYKGDKPLTDAQKRVEYKKLTKYFLASLAIPDDHQWVNLSPYEKDRIIKDDFGKTEMGRDLLAQDYMLKQITASLIYPEDNLGKQFWNRVYSEAQAQYETTNIPVNTFNKVWIIPDDAVIYEKGNTAYVLKNHLKVMLEEDYLSLKKHAGISSIPPLFYKEGARESSKNINAIGSKIVRQIVLPALEREVNEGENFATVRQIYSGILLAAWYKRALKESFLNKVYADKAKVKGVDSDPKINEEIYEQYIKAYKKGVFNFIKDDVDKYTNETIPRKYFSGGGLAYQNAGQTSGEGAVFDQAVRRIKQLDADQMQAVQADKKELDLASVAAVEDQVKTRGNANWQRVLQSIENNKPGNTYPTLADVRDLANQIASIIPDKAGRTPDKVEAISELKKQGEILAQLTLDWGNVYVGYKKLRVILDKILEIERGVASLGVGVTAHYGNDLRPKFTYASIGAQAGHLRSQRKVFAFKPDKMMKSKSNSGYHQVVVDVHLGEKVEDFIIRLLKIAGKKNGEDVIGIYKDRIISILGRNDPSAIVGSNYVVNSGTSSEEEYILTLYKQSLFFNTRVYGNIASIGGSYVSKVFRPVRNFFSYWWNSADTPLLFHEADQYRRLLRMEISSQQVVVAPFNPAELAAIRTGALNAPQRYYSGFAKVISKTVPVNIADMLGNTRAEEYETPDVASARVANMMISELEANNEAGRDTRWILPTGGTYELIYQKFRELVLAQGVRLDRLYSYNMDEYCPDDDYVGVWSQDPHSYQYFMNFHLFNYLRGYNLGWVDNHAHFLNGQATDDQAESLNYEEAMRENGGIETTWGGLGPPTHIAFNDPRISETSSREDIRDHNEFIISGPKAEVMGKIFDLLKAHWSSRQEAEFAETLMEEKVRIEKNVSIEQLRVLAHKLLMKQRTSIALDDLQSFDLGELQVIADKVAQKLGLKTTPRVEFIDAKEAQVSRTRRVAPAIGTIRANIIYYTDDVTKMPVEARTIGFRDLMDARKVVIAALKSSKANPLQRSLETAPSLSVPGALLQNHPGERVYFIFDVNAGANITAPFRARFKPGVMPILDMMMDAKIIHQLAVGVLTNILSKAAVESAGNWELLKKQLFMYDHFSLWLSDTRLIGDEKVVILSKGESNGRVITASELRSMKGAEVDSINLNGFELVDQAAAYVYVDQAMKSAVLHKLNKPMSFEIRAADGGKAEVFYTGKTLNLRYPGGKKLYTYITEQGALERRAVDYGPYLFVLDGEELRIFRINSQNTYSAVLINELLSANVRSSAELKGLIQLLISNGFKFSSDGKILQQVISMELNGRQGIKLQSKVFGVKNFVLNRMKVMRPRGRAKVASNRVAQRRELVDVDRQMGSSISDAGTSLKWILAWIGLGFALLGDPAVIHQTRENVFENINALRFSPMEEHSPPVNIIRHKFPSAPVKPHSVPFIRGGIDFNAANLHLIIKRDGNGVPLPISQQDMASLSHLQGLDPVILSIHPASSLPFFSQLQAKS